MLGGKVVWDLAQRFIARYRIDHILYNNRMKLHSICKIGANGLSDHDALVAVLGIP